MRTALGLLLTFTCVPAFAQMSMGGGGMGGMAGGPGAGGAPTPRAHVPDIAPPALPGAGSAPLATGPVMQKLTTGDPTAALFAAINSGNYSSAQDAISRGANMNAENGLGETPLDLAIALNRTNITFMLLAARNEMGGNDGTATPVVMTTPGTHSKTRKPHITPVTTNIRSVTETAPKYTTVPVMEDNPGTPNPSAGFLGFDPKN
jgi:hypothetical protein